MTAPRTHTNTLTHALTLATLAGLSSGRHAVAQYTVQRLMATGDTAVGAPAPMVSALAPLIDRFGQVAMTLNFTDGQTRHIVRGLNQMTTMLKVGDAAPGLAGAFVTTVGSPTHLAPDGELLVGYTTPGAAFRYAVGDPFDWTLAFSPFYFIPGREPNQFDTPPQSILMSDGRVIAFRHEGTLGAGVYRRVASPGGGLPLQRLLATGDRTGPFSDATEVVLHAISPAGPALLRVDEWVTFSQSQVRGLYTTVTGDFLTPIAVSGGQAPQGGVFVSNAEPRGSMNNAGQVIFAWKTDVSNTNIDSGIWLHTPGQGLIMLAREGLGTPIGGFITYDEAYDYAGVENVMRSPIIGPAGHVVFVARLRGSGVVAANDTAIFAGLPGQLALVAREGMSTGAGAPVLGDLLDLDVNYWVNARGDVVFKANRVDNGEVLWHRSADGFYSTIIAATGRQLPGAGGQLRTINRISNPDRSSGGQDGRSSILNDNGQVAFAVSFTDGSYGVYRSTLPSVCYPNCDGSTVAPVLNALDFSCFLSSYVAAQALPSSQQITSYANCDSSTVAPVLNALDFSCFLARYREACP